MNLKRPTHTFSIVARDPHSGEFGVAVQSHWFGVGAVVSWAEAGVGAIATQSFSNPDFGPNGLERLRSGQTADQTLTELLSSDTLRTQRQVAIVDSKGRVATYTGEQCISWAGHQQGNGYSVQANIMLDERTVPAMAEAYETTSGTLAERLLAALEAGQAAGGDLRGQQSAALRVVGPEESRSFTEASRVDLRIDDHPQPITELRRLYRLHQAYTELGAGEMAIAAGDLEATRKHYRAAAKYAPEQLEIVVWTALALAATGELENAVPMFRRAFAAEPNWIHFVERLPDAGLIDSALVKKILAATLP